MSLDGQKLFRVVPQQESKCVWMTAGILSYQLCDRQFECDLCPLDIALRQRFGQHEPSYERERAQLPSQKEEDPGVKVLFGRKHLWLRREEERRVRLGIEPGLASVLLSPMEIVLPALGAQIERGKVSSWIALGGGTLPLLSPMTGQVTATNSLLAEHPHAVCESPVGDGWLYELSVIDADFDGADIIPTADVARIYADDEQPLRQLLAEQTAEDQSYQGPLGHSRAVERLAEKLGPAEYLNLLRRIYS